MTQDVLEPWMPNSKRLTLDKRKRAMELIELGWTTAQVAMQIVIEFRSGMGHAWIRQRVNERKAKLTAATK